MNSTDEFLKALQLIKPLPILELEYRIHYDDQGNITMCTMQQHPNSTQYIVVTKEEYHNYYQYRVENKKLKLIDTGSNYSVQLKKSNSGYKVVKNHAGILIEPDEAYADTEYYDTNN